MPRKWDMSEVTEMLGPEGRFRVIWEHIWRGDTLLIIFDKPGVPRKVEYIMYRKGRTIYYGLRGKQESELEQRWDEDPGVHGWLHNAIAQGAKFQASEGRVWIEL